MSNEGTEFRTGVGRIVWGHPLKSQVKRDQQTNQPVLKDGQPIQQWAFGVAFPAAEFLRDIWPLMAAEGQKGYPNGVPGHFSWKIKNGDTDIDRQGKRYSEREGYAGCYVVTFTTELMATPVYKWENGQWMQIAPDGIKAGDWVSVKGKFVVNVPKNATHTPGLYVNPVVVELVGYGTEIVGSGTVDPNQALGAGPSALPPGASATPQSSAPGNAPGMPGTPPAPGQPPQPGSMPGAPPQAAPPAPGTMPPPAHDFVPGGATPGAVPPAPGAQPGMMPPPPAPPAPAGPQRPTDPAHIHAAGTPQEMWWINGAWQAAPR